MNENIENTVVEEVAVAPTTDENAMPTTDGSATPTTDGIEDVTKPQTEEIAENEGEPNTGTVAPEGNEIAQKENGGKSNIEIPKIFVPIDPQNEAAEKAAEELNAIRFNINKAKADKKAAKANLKMLMGKTYGFGMFGRFFGGIIQFFRELIRKVCDIVGIKYELSPSQAEIQAAKAKIKETEHGIPQMKKREKEIKREFGIEKEKPHKENVFTRIGKLFKRNKEQPANDDITAEQRAPEQETTEQQRTAVKNPRAYNGEKFADLMKQMEPSVIVNIDGEKADLHYTSDPNASVIDEVFEDDTPATFNLATGTISTFLPPEQQQMVSLADLGSMSTVALTQRISEGTLGEIISGIQNNKSSQFEISGISFESKTNENGKTTIYAILGDSKVFVAKADTAEISADTIRQALNNAAKTTIGFVRDNAFIENLSTNEFLNKHNVLIEDGKNQNGTQQMTITVMVGDDTTVNTTSYTLNIDKKTLNVSLVDAPQDIPAEHMSQLGMIQSTVRTAYTNFLIADRGMKPDEIITKGTTRKAIMDMLSNHLKDGKEETMTEFLGHGLTITSSLQETTVDIDGDSKTIQEGTITLKMSGFDPVTLVVKDGKVQGDEAMVYDPLNKLAGEITATVIGEMETEAQMAMQDREAPTIDDTPQIGNGSQEDIEYSNNEIEYKLDGMSL